jgi:putative ABC transport system permease protein
MGTAILVLAATIGASTAIFALVDAVLIRPLPLTDQNRLVVMWAAEPGSPLIEISYPDFLDFRNETKAFEDLAAHGSTPWSLLMTGVGDPVVMAFGAVSGSFFDVLGARAHLGRTLHPSDEAPGAPAVVVLSHPLWQQRFGSDPSVVGRVISLDNEPHTVVGIMPARFNYPAGSQLWAPLNPPSTLWSPTPGTTCAASDSSSWWGVWVLESAPTRQPTIPRAFCVTFSKGTNWPCRSADRS